MVSADAARELLEGSTPGPWCAGRSSSGHLCIAQTTDPGEDVAVALDAIFADAALMAAAPDLARTVVALHERVAAVEAERDRMREREEHFARVLSVTDGGQYRADWDSAIRRVVAERDALRKRVADAEYDINREVEARNAAGAELDAVLAHADELTQALRETQRERDALRDIIEGRATPPTDSDIAVHVARGGLWRTRRTIGDTMLSRDGVDADRAERVRDEQARTGGVYLWWALDAHGRPCAWPEVPRG